MGEPATEHLPPVAKPSEQYQREPDLLTHRDDDYLSESVGDGYPGQPSGALGTDRKKPRRKKIWRWVRRGMYAVIFLLIAGPITAFYVIYQNVAVPDPQTVAFGQAQPVTLYYADGSVMDKLTTGARTYIKPDQIPVNIRHAVEAAEDETFETNSGFDLKAIGRTVWNQATGGQGGGSTITQEYIKVATGNDQHTLSRKVSEVVQAYKMTKTYPSKNDILAAYLNIVYFGRGAYGIDAAAHAYYNTSPDKLTPEQSALIAGMIQLPGYANVPKYQHNRFDYVWGRMNANHMVTPQQYSAGQFPAPQPAENAGHQAVSWDIQLIENRVMNELAAKGWSEDSLKRQGAQIYTTINPNAQKSAENAVNQVMSKDTEYANGGPLVVNGKPITVPAQNKQGQWVQVPVRATETAALVSVDQHNGEIVAYYGGNDPTATQYDMAATPHQPGSSFKPYVLAAGLETNPQQIGLNAVYDPTSPQTIAGHVVHNSDGDVCPSPCTVKKAMTQSINTVFYKMGNDIKTGSVRTAALQAGISKTEYNPTKGVQEPSLTEVDANGNPTVPQGGISIGQYRVQPLDQAQGYATIANNGQYIPDHFVRKVTDITGHQSLWQSTETPTPAFDQDPTKSSQIAKTVADSLTDVASSSNFALANNRPSDAKTGTQGFNDAQGTATQNNSDAWTVGFTPQVTTAVWFGHYDAPGPIFGNYHNGYGSNHGYAVYGREEPGFIWKAYMDSYLANQQVTQFPTQPQDIGGSWNFITNQDQSTVQSTTTTPSTDTQSQTGTTTSTDQQTTTSGHRHGPPGTSATQPIICSPLSGCTTFPGGGGGFPGGGGGPGNNGAPPGQFGGG